MEEAPIDPEPKRRGRPLGVKDSKPRKKKEIVEQPIAAPIVNEPKAETRAESPPRFLSAKDKKRELYAQWFS